MEYYRFTRQCICVDEVGYSGLWWGTRAYQGYIADVIILTKSNYIHEIEVKCTKSDLCSLELKKEKHSNMTNEYYPHYFSFAVPSKLIEDAKIMITKLNPKYGLIEITSHLYPPITIRKKAQRLHHNQEQIESWKHKIIYRLNSALIGYMKRTHIKEVNNGN